MQYIIIAILILISLAIGIYLWLILRQINNLSKQLEFLAKHESRMQLTSSFNNKSISKLTALINSQIKDMAELRIHLKNEKVTSEDTIAGLSHDIRTPLTSLDGYLQLLKQTDDPVKQQAYLVIMQERVKSLRKILDELFIYAKLQQADYLLELETININEVLTQNILMFYEDFKRHNIEPEINYKKENVMIQANTNALERVLQNVLRNVLLHGAGDLNISLSIIEAGKDEESEPKLCLSFSNRMRPDSTLHTEQVFDKFYKGNPSRHNSSTGLGLAIAKNLTEKMNGKLNVEIEENIFVLQIQFPVKTLS
ncbi:MAG TPA: HAMP domain-containing histidine kinase [Clostridiaceae bacterium]|mgnify:CR=1 FL=1|nr:HAMP domain-containing histidine kinase [Clostridiaceae bacterium]